MCVRACERESARASERASEREREYRMREFVYKLSPSHTQLHVCVSLYTGVLLPYTRSLLPGTRPVDCGRTRGLPLTPAASVSRC